MTSETRNYSIPDLSFDNVRTLHFLILELLTDTYFAGITHNDNLSQICVHLNSELSETQLDDLDDLVANFDPDASYDVDMNSQNVEDPDDVMEQFNSLKITSAKGDLITDTGTTGTVISLGTSGQILSVNTNASGGISWSELTQNKGDLVTHDGTNRTLLPIGTNGQILTVDTGATNNLIWQTPTAFCSVVFSDVKSVGTNGGTFSSSSWRTRDLNTMSGVNLTGVSLSNDKFTLPEGTWVIEAKATAFGVNNHKIRLQNITDSEYYYGMNSYAPAPTSYYVYFGYTGDSKSILHLSLTISQSTEFKIQHYCERSRSNDGFGRSLGSGDEIYAVVQCTQIE